MYIQRLRILIERVYNNEQEKENIDCRYFRMFNFCCNVCY